MSAKDIDTVTSFDDREVVKFGGNRRERKKPFKFQIGDSPVFTVEEPDADTVMDIEEATTLRRALKLFVGDQYDAVEDHLGPEHPDELVDLLRSISRYFGLDDTDSTMNRAERRSRDRRRGRRG